MGSELEKEEWCKSKVCIVKIILKNGAYFNSNHVLCLQNYSNQTSNCTLNLKYPIKFDYLQLAQS